MIGLKSISIIIPAYNEEKRISSTLNSYLEFLSPKKIKYEIIVVANNCSDKTVEIAKKYQKKNKNLKIMELPYYTGKGGAVIEGFKKARNEIICFADADNSAKPDQVFMLATMIGKYDAVIGSRAMPDSKILNPQPISRIFLGKCFSILTNALFGFGIIDTQCGAKAFSKKAVQIILQHQISKGFEFDVQILWIIKKSGLQILEKGIEWDNNPDSRVGLLDPLKMFLSIIKLRLGL